VSTTTSTSGAGDEIEEKDLSLALGFKAIRQTQPILLSKQSEKSNIHGRRNESLLKG
jgi:hypothetical protein